MVRILSIICKVFWITILLLVLLSNLFGYMTVDEDNCSKIVSRVQTADRYGNPKYFINTVQETFSVSPLSFEQSKGMEEWCFIRSKFVLKDGWKAIDFSILGLILIVSLILDLILSIFLK